MTRRPPLRLPVAIAATALLSLLSISANAQGNYPITEKQRSTANRVAQEGGVLLSELRDNAPDSHTVKSGDTLWDISKLFLKSPWRWPELWGMNMEQVKNPHLIYPGQILFLDKRNGRASLRLGNPVGGKLQPSVRTSGLRDNIPAVSMAQIEPFLNEAVIFDTDSLNTAPRIVAAQDGRVMLSRGELAYVRGDLQGQSNFRVFRDPKPLRDPATQKILGYEAVYLGAAELTRKGDGTGAASQATDIVPDTFTISSVRQEIRAGDRLSPIPSRDFSSYTPHAPQNPIMGQIASVYGEAVTAGQNQIVSLNKGQADGLEPGHILALWRDGARIKDPTDPQKAMVKLPDEHHGTLFVFRVFNRMSYALILTVKDPVNVGDRFTQP
jgi:LysM repeat protein